jgi:D-amino-acid dehydrogenase
VTLVDKRGPGEETSYGNTGVIVGASVFPTPFPRSLKKLAQVALKRAPEANYHAGDLLKIAPWLLSYFGFSTEEKLKDSAVKMRPLMSRSVAEHKVLLEESGAMKYLRENGWITLYRTDAAFAAMQPQLEFGATIGVAAQTLDTEGTLALEPSLVPVFRHALMWPDVASISNPLMVTRAYAARFAALGGKFVNGDARTLHRSDGHWRVDTGEGPVEAAEAIVALGPWSTDVIEPLGIKVPLGIKRGYHRHYDPKGNASLSRPVIDIEYGYALTPMEQGQLTLAPSLRRATRRRRSTVRPRAAGGAGVISLGAQNDSRTGSGAGRTCRMRCPSSGARPGKRALARFRHGHWELTLSPVTGRLIADMMTGATRRSPTGALSRRALQLRLADNSLPLIAISRPASCRVPTLWPCVERHRDKRRDADGRSFVDVPSNRGILDAGSQQDEHRHQGVDPERRGGGRGLDSE